MLVSFPSGAAFEHPLAALDTSSPRSLLYGYLTTTTEIYRRGTEVILGYSRSGRLFMTADEREVLYRVKDEAFKLIPAFDLSAFPSITRLESSRRLMVQLKEVLDRVELPL